jgi:signal transduction histidine kinase
VRAWGPDDPEVDAATAGRAARREVPTWTDLGDRRVLLLPVDVEAHGQPHHGIVVASAPRPTLPRTVGAFATLYVASAALLGSAAAAGQRRLVARALDPVARAGADVARVSGAGQGARVDEDGPAEIRALLRSVNELLGRLDAAWTAQARFTAEAAHELRTPVTSMLGELDVALRRPRSPEEYARVLGSVRDDVLRLGRLVEGLMALARVDSGQAAADRTREAAADLARRALDLEGPGLARAGCPVTLDVRDDAEVEVHEPLVVAALANLLRNAAVHAPGRPVRMWVARRGDRVAVGVDDAGPGIPPADREAVFDRFARGGEARRTSDGLGLGLPLAREVARRHGGECRIEDGAAGARVVMELPVA